MIREDGPFPNEGDNDIDRDNMMKKPLQFGSVPACIPTPTPTTSLFPASEDLLLLESLGQLEDESSLQRQNQCKGRSSRLTVYVRAPRTSVVDSAATSIQAFVRGGLVRRQSVLGPFANNQCRRSSWIGSDPPIATTIVAEEESPVRESLVTADMPTTTYIMESPPTSESPSDANALIMTGVNNLSDDAHIVTDQSSSSSVGVTQKSLSSSNAYSTQVTLTSRFDYKPPEVNENTNPNIVHDVNVSTQDIKKVATSFSTSNVRRSHRQSTLHYFNSFMSPTVASDSTYEESTLPSKDDDCYNSLDTSPLPPVCADVSSLPLTAGKVTSSVQQTVPAQSSSMSLSELLKNKIARSMNLLRRQLALLESLENNNREEEDGTSQNYLVSGDSISSAKDIDDDLTTLLESVEEEKASLTEFRSAALLLLSSSNSTSI
jgi:hypothetical protein